jgi:hypothetical protein
MNATTPDGGLDTGTAQVPLAYSNFPPSDRQALETILRDADLNHDGAELNALLADIAQEDDLSEDRNLEFDEDIHFDEELRPSVFDSDNEFTFSFSDDIPHAFRELDSFTAHHLTPLFPNHLSYPSVDDACAICKGPFGIAHPPVLVVNVPGWVGHVYGYECLRRRWGAGW